MLTRKRNETTDKTILKLLFQLTSDESRTIKRQQNKNNFTILIILKITITFGINFWFFYETRQLRSISIAVKNDFTYTIKDNYVGIRMSEKNFTSLT